MSFGNVAKDCAVTSLAALRTIAAKSANGNFAGDIRRTGKLVQYQRSPDTWVTAETLTVPSTQLGNVYSFPNEIFEIAINGDGSVIAVGMNPLANPPGTPLLYIMKNTAGFYSQQSLPLPSDAININIGSVSLSENGTLCAFGSGRDNNNIGAVWIYALVAGVWSQQGLKITGPGEIGQGQFGDLVSLSGDGKLLAVAAPFDGSSGAAYIFGLDSPSSPIFIARLVGTPINPSASFGNDVSFSADGSTLAVGASSNLSNAGSVFIYTNVGGEWQQQVFLTAPPGAGIFLGKFVSLSGDGNTLAAFARNGGVMYYRTGTSWSSGTLLPLPFDIVGSLTNLGRISLSSDGATLINSSDFNDGFSGASWVCTEGPAETWTQNGPALKVANPAPNQKKSGVISGNGKVAALFSADSIPGKLVWVFI